MLLLLSLSLLSLPSLLLFVVAVVNQSGNGQPEQIGDGEDVHDVNGGGEDVNVPVAEDDFVFPDHQELADNAAADAVEIEDAPLSPPPAPPPAPDAPRVWTEDARGYIRVPSRAAPIGRITAWGRSLSARCSLHARCTRPYTIASLPNARTLPEWLIAGIGLDHASDHTGLPKPST